MAIGDPVQDPGSETSAAPTPIPLSDDAMIVPPGAKDPVKWKDYISGYHPKAEFEQRAQEFEQRQRQARELLVNEARRLDQLRKSGHPQPTAAQPTAQQPDPLADLRGRPFVDGRSVVDLFERAKREGLDPLHQWAQQVNQAFNALNQRLQSYEQRFGTYEQQRNETQLNDWVTKTIKDAGYDPQDPLLRRDLENYYYSHEPEQGQPKSVLFSEIPRMWAEDMAARQKFFREADRKRAEEARKAPRVPTKGGGASPTGPRKYQFESPRQLAQRFFSGRETSAEHT